MTLPRIWSGPAPTAVAGLLLAAGACVRPIPPPPTLFPVSTTWVAPIGQVLDGPLATDGSRIFALGRDGFVLALDRATGYLKWDVEIAPQGVNYGATSAPLVVGDVVITGVSGGDEGVRGFIDGYLASTGERLWRFWTVPAPGEPFSETWKGKDIEHGGATTWQTGSYDPELGLVYWTTGNPGPLYNGDQRLGDNLYAASILALDAKTGSLKWYFQVTPHNVWDWDAQQPLALVDSAWEGRPRKLLLHVSRNGFFYVFDRATGQRLLTKQFVKKLTWAKEIGPDGRPVLNPNQEPSEQHGKRRFRGKRARRRSKRHDSGDYYALRPSPRTAHLGR